MKKLDKLKINAEKIMKDEDLMYLKGGYGEPGDCHCMCYERIDLPSPMGLMAAWNHQDCLDNCDIMGWTGTWNCMYS